MVDDVAAWNTFYLMVGDVIAALTGRVFVAMSLHLREILERPDVTRNVAAALAGLVAGLVFCGFMLLPGVTIVDVGVVLALSGIGMGLLFARQGPARWNVVAERSCFYDVALVVLLVVGWGKAMYGVAAGIAFETAALIRMCWRLLTLAVTQ
jgi:hypothetical protein